LKNKFTVFIKSNLPAIAWSGFILLLCGLPGSEFPDMSKWRLFSVDKLVHAFLFLVLVFLSITGLKKQFAIKILKYNAIIVSLGWAVFLGVGSEIMQSLIFVERSADLFDIAANAIGAFLGLVAFYFVYGKENTFRFN
jgi:VanZ family protein